MDKECHKYDDIIDLPHHVSDKHPQMTMEMRAAQFSPFAALTGYEDAVTETARLTDTEITLDETQKAVIDEGLRILNEHIAERPETEITFFQPDKRKAGGAYVHRFGNLKRIDYVNRLLYFTDGTSIQVEHILQIESPIIDSIRIHLD